MYINVYEAAKQEFMQHHVVKGEFKVTPGYGKRLKNLKTQLGIYEKTLDPVDVNHMKRFIESAERIGHKKRLTAFYIVVAIIGITLIVLL